MNENREDDDFKIIEDENDIVPIEDPLDEEEEESASSRMSHTKMTIRKNDNIILEEKIMKGVKKKKEKEEEKEEEDVEHKKFEIQDVNKTIKETIEENDFDDFDMLNMQIEDQVSMNLGNSTSIRPYDNVYLTVFVNEDAPTSSEESSMTEDIPDIRIHDAYIDIGANLTDDMFHGVYHGTKKHEDDFEEMMKRAENAKVLKMIVTVGSLDDIPSARALCKENKGILFHTIGIHPTRCNIFEEEGEEKVLTTLTQCLLGGVATSTVVAVGEIGLDYDRLHFCDKQTQKKFFIKQIKLGETHTMPLFLHLRNAFSDFYHILKEKCTFIRPVVIHSFDGTLEEMNALLNLSNNLYIGLNGCSLKTEQNLLVAAKVPLDKLMLETDCPWCGIRRSHASYDLIKTHFQDVKNKKKKVNDTKMVKGRSEPTSIIQVAEVIAHLKKIPLADVALNAYRNTVKVFFTSSTYSSDQSSNSSSSSIMLL
mmetsp:Transcript_7639/g.11343  ORF Transcript_7639/g.11343 Transcript_7639/m.11343 type:complete len:480 (+) Transcript_7639:30-1469(+)